MRLVQRHGRVDRIGSPHDRVFLRTIFPVDRLDELLNLEQRILGKLAQAAASIGVAAPIEGAAHGAQVFTEARGGVYYEAGFAHGLGIEVIFTCKENALENVHFDTRQHNHIVWKKPEELRQGLAKRISARIGDGPHKENSTR